MTGGVVRQIIGSFGIYRRGLLFYLCLIPLVVAGYYFVTANVLRADLPLGQELQLSLGEDGIFRLGRASLDVEVFRQNETIRYRYQVVDGLQEYREEMIITVSLPRPVTEEMIAHRFINNGGAMIAESKLIDPQTVEFRAIDIYPEAQLAIELEIPATLVSQTALALIKMRFDEIPLGFWIGLSVGLPVLTLLVLLLVLASRFRSVAPLGEAVENLPAKLPPALLGILLRGRVTSKELAATLLDLARRGHLIIRQVGGSDFRFRRRQGFDQLHDFEQNLLDQIFGPAGDKASSEEVSFYLAQEIFSKKISQSFALLYKKINDLGYFYANPLRLHRRYQAYGLVMFLLGIVGFATILLFGDGIYYLLLFWAGMIFSSFVIISLSKNLPSRTIIGDRELSKWLAFRRYLCQNSPINFQAFNQERYLSYLPYAIVLDVEIEWTKRFYHYPFTQPTWFFAPGIVSIEAFANRLFPLLGYLAHVLSLSSQPANR